jgi:hypothetical protein
VNARRFFPIWPQQRASRHIRAGPALRLTSFEPRATYNPRSNSSPFSIFGKEADVEEVTADAEDAALPTRPLPQRTVPRVPHGRQIPTPATMLPQNPEGQSAFELQVITRSLGRQICAAGWDASSPLTEPVQPR